MYIGADNDFELSVGVAVSAGVTKSTPWLHVQDSITSSYTPLAHQDC